MIIKGAIIHIFEMYLQSLSSVLFCVVECRFLWLCWRREIKKLNGREYLCYWGDFMRAAILTVISPRLTAWSWYSKCCLFILKSIYIIYNQMLIELFCVCVQELSSLLSMEAMSFVTEERKTPQESASPNTYTFDLFGGVDVSFLLI